MVYFSLIILIFIIYGLYKLKILRILFLIFSVGLILLFFYFKMTEKSVLFNFLLPPKDLYKPFLVENVFDISKKGKYVFNLKHKYPGAYTVDIFVEKPVSISEVAKKTYKVNYKINLVFYFEKKILKKEIISQQSPFWSGGVEKKYLDGFACFNYKVPKDLPRNKEIILELEVVEPDKNFEKLYGKQKLCIRKSSDE